MARTSSTVPTRRMRPDCMSAALLQVERIIATEWLARTTMRLRPMNSFQRGAFREPRINGRDALIHEQNAGLDRGCNREAKAGQHSGRIGPHWQRQILAKFADLLDLRNFG